MKLKRINNRSIIIISILIISIFLIIWYSSKQVTSVRMSGEESIAVPFNQDTKIIKHFVSSYNDLHSLSFRFGTYNNPNISGTISVKVSTKTEKIYEGEIELEDLVDNVFYKISFPKQKDSYNKEYTIELTGNSNIKNNPLVIWTYESKEGIIIDGKNQELDLDFEYKGRTRNKSLLIYIPLYIAIIGLVILFRGDKKYE